MFDPGRLLVVSGGELKKLIQINSVWPRSLTYGKWWET